MTRTEFDETFSVLCKKNIIQILKKVKKTIGNNLIIDKQTLTIVNNFYL